MNHPNEDLINQTIEEQAKLKKREKIEKKFPNLKKELEDAYSLKKVDKIRINLLGIQLGLLMVYSFSVGFFLSTSETPILDFILFSIVFLAFSYIIMSSKAHDLKMRNMDKTFIKKITDRIKERLGK